MALVQVFRCDGPSCVQTADSRETIGVMPVMPDEWVSIRGPYVERRREEYAFCGWECLREWAAARDTP